MRKEFIETTSKIVQENFNSALLLGDISVFGFKNLLEKEPYRAFNLGILEQSIVGIGAGFAMKGFFPFIHTIAPFLVERAYEQIKIDFGYQKLPGNFVSVGSSFDYSTLGCTHHCPADIHLISNIPGTKIFIPGHAHELQTSIVSNWNSGRLNYFRLSELKNEKPIQKFENSTFRVKNGKKALAIAVGPMLQPILDCLQNEDVEIRYLNEIDTKSTLKIPELNNHKKLIIVEPYYSGVILNNLELDSLNGIQVLQIGVRKEFIEKYGTINDILNFLQLDSKSLFDKITNFVYERK